MTLPTTTSDVLIVGGGPAGFTAAIYAVRAGLSVTALIGMSQPGGALTTTTDVENYPGFTDGIAGPELMEAMQAQAERLGANVLCEDVTTLASVGGSWAAITEDAEVHAARAVIVATGAAHKHLGVPGETLAGVSYCATCDGSFFAGQDVVVVGGGDTACEEALYLAPLASSVTLLVRSGAMRASVAMQDKVTGDERITVRYDSPVAEITGQDKVTGVQLTNGEALAATGVFVAIGHVPRSELAAKAGAATDAGGYLVTARGTEHVTATTVPGLFAAGDVADPTYRQAITAAASGCQAAIDVRQFLAGV
ncbi:FAD-dependent oxidoreductase [Cellulosimicrobium sp. Marseille-Q4280]|uniref:NAD(P)/FAD-dependent oxidoreductase n=1 Tax=Cellulosimicrobium sp. Marseille-Q4280 TaxID=2937992 RepID=UPI00203C6E52|nr:FAD-dependent oxidoreductase [Cellulosimicrobium sp. Marseille-Q4280]